MRKTLMCVERRDFHRIVDISRQYAGNDLSKCYVFSKKGYTAEFYKERQVNGVDCVIFGWSRYELNKYHYDIYGIQLTKDELKKGYVLMEFEDNMMINFKNRSKIPELAQAMNIDKIITRDDFSTVLGENRKEEEEEFE